MGPLSIATTNIMWNLGGKRGGSRARVNDVSWWLTAYVDGREVVMARRCVTDASACVLYRTNRRSTRATCTATKLARPAPPQPNATIRAEGKTRQIERTGMNVVSSTSSAQAQSQ